MHLVCFSPSNVKCRKYITSSVIPIVFLRHESDLGQMGFFKKKKKNTSVCCNLLGLLFGLKGGGWQTEQNKEDLKVWTIPGRHFSKSLHYTHWTLCCLNWEGGVNSTCHIGKSFYLLNLKHIWVPYRKQYQKYCK